MFCTECGSPTEKTVNFCLICGSKTATSNSVDPVAARDEETVEQTSVSFKNSQSSRSIDQQIISPRRKVSLVVVGVGALAICAVVFLALNNRKSSDDVVAASSVPSVTTVSEAVEFIESETSIAMTGEFRLGLGDVNQACTGANFSTTATAGEVIFRSETDSIFVTDRWVVGAIRVVVLNCDDTTVVVSLKVDEGRIEVVDSENAYDVEFTKFKPRLLRLGLDGLCCFPEVPYSSVKLLRLSATGIISTEESEIARFPNWNPSSKSCDAYTPADYYASENIDGMSFQVGAPGYVTVCSKGNEVELLQNSLIRAGYDIESDGLFGPATLAALSSEAEASGLMNIHGAVTYEGFYEFARTSRSYIGD